jgi:hypothetical protein
MDKINCLQKEAGAKKMFAMTTTPKKIVCVDEMSIPPSKKIMVRPLLWEIHGFLIPFHNNFAMGMVGFYMEMIWEHDMEFIWFSMYKLWEWYGCNNYHIILGMVRALVFIPYQTHVNI